MAVSIPCRVIGIFYLLDPSGRNVALGFYSVSNRNEYQQYLLRGTGGLCVGLTTLPLSCAECLQILGTSTSWRPKGLSRPVICTSHIIINPLKPELNPICYLLALLGAHYFLHVSRIRVKLLTLR